MWILSPFPEGLDQKLWEGVQWSVLQPALQGIFRPTETKRWDPPPGNIKNEPLPWSQSLHTKRTLQEPGQISGVQGLRGWFPTNYLVREWSFHQHANCNYSNKYGALTLCQALSFVLDINLSIQPSYPSKVEADYPHFIHVNAEATQVQWLTQGPRSVTQAPALWLWSPELLCWNHFKTITNKSGSALPMNCRKNSARRIKPVPVTAFSRQAGTWWMPCIIHSQGTQTAERTTKLAREWAGMYLL